MDSPSISYPVIRFPGTAQIYRALRFLMLLSRATLVEWEHVSNYHYRGSSFVTENTEISRVSNGNLPSPACVEVYLGVKVDENSHVNLHDLKCPSVILCEAQTDADSWHPPVPPSHESIAQVRPKV